MKNEKLLAILLLIIFSAGIESCKHKSKESTWSDVQKTKWKTECQQLLIKREVSKKDAIDFCDCMLKKTSEKYTPAEVIKISTEEERKLWQECDYQW